MKPVRLLVTARDPSSANDICSLLHMLPDNFEVLVAAQNPAYQVFSTSANSPFLTNCSTRVLFNIGDDLVSELIDSILNQFSPSIIITGVSSLGHGIDEYTLLAANILGIYQLFQFKVIGAMLILALACFLIICLSLINMHSS